MGAVEGGPDRSYKGRLLSTRRAGVLAGPAAAAGVRKRETKLSQSPGTIYTVSNAQLSGVRGDREVENGDHRVILEQTLAG